MQCRSPIHCKLSISLSITRIDWFHYLRTDPVSKSENILLFHSATHTHQHIQNILYSQIHCTRSSLDDNSRINVHSKMGIDLLHRQFYRYYRDLSIGLVGRFYSHLMRQQCMNNKIHGKVHTNHLIQQVQMGILEGSFHPQHARNNLRHIMCMRLGNLLICKMYIHLDISRRFPSLKFRRSNNY